MRAAFANSLWQMTASGEARRFHQATTRVAETQTNLLHHYWHVNRATDFGRRHNFAKLASVEDYQRSVPLTTYDDYVDDIQHIANGRRNILTAQPVQLFEPSSGSTAASKLVPYTALLKAEFQRALAVWIADLFAHRPDLKAGPAYWSITPLSAGRRSTAGGLPIGFEEDSAYLGPLGALIESTLAVPNLVKHLGDVTNFRYVTLLYLLRQPELRIISVWNPTFLALLLKPLAEWWESLLADIAAGGLTPPAPLDPALALQLRRTLPPDPRRASRLAALSPGAYAAIWPRLGLLSCWADGPAGPYAQALQAQFPSVSLQPKGLLATEAFVSLPLVNSTGGVLAITSHFFEFLPAPKGQPDPTRPARLAHQLEKGGTYSVVVTTGGGLYRYQLHDIVEVTGFVGAAPCLQFVGRADHISDWFGEKLSEHFVARALSEIFKHHGLSPAFALLAPDDRHQFRYTLYLELDTQDQPIGLPQTLDTALRENFHYNYCRQLEQLAEPRVTLVKNGIEAYLRAGGRRGQKLGNIKPVALQNTTGWAQWFEMPEDSREARPLLV